MGHRTSFDHQGRAAHASHDAAQAVRLPRWMAPAPPIFAPPRPDNGFGVRKAQFTKDHVPARFTHAVQKLIPRGAVVAPVDRVLDECTLIAVNQTAYSRAEPVRAVEQNIAVSPSTPPPPPSPEILQRWHRITSVAYGALTASAIMFVSAGFDSIHAAVHALGPHSIAPLPALLLLTGLGTVVSFRLLEPNIGQASTENELKHRVWWLLVIAVLLLFPPTQWLTFGHRSKAIAALPSASASRAAARTPAASSLRANETSVRRARHAMRLRVQRHRLPSDTSTRSRMGGMNMPGSSHKLTARTLRRTSSTTGGPSMGTIGMADTARKGGSDG